LSYVIADSAWLGVVPFPRPDSRRSPGSGSWLISDRGDRSAVREAETMWSRQAGGHAEPRRPGV